MRILEYTIPTEYDGFPLVHYLREKLKLSAFIVRIFRNTPDTIYLNGEHVRVIDKVKAGDHLTLKIPENSTPPLLWDMELDIMYEDEDVLVINKPSGISVHPTFNHPNFTLCNAVASYLIKTKNEPAAGRAIGRLDKVTSGVMVFAKNIVASSKLNGNMQKVYNALVWGNTPESGTINAPIFRPDKGKTSRCVDPRGDEAITHYKTIAQSDNKSFVEVTTETGRTHQIRVHFDHIGHTLLGDEMYGGDNTEHVKRAALHCRQVSIVHPVTDEPLTFVAPYPEDMENELKKWLTTATISVKIPFAAY
ncbi:MAG: RluA family pseudouridine synthase [Clostridia bacterium]|nr:RluA family pseudouridine synthase [Clostridia bacterium]